MNPAAQSQRTKTLSHLALSVTLLSICSWIAVPTAIPFTMQTFGVFVVLGLLGGKRGTLAILCYLLVGLVGLPVFSGFTSGIGMLLGTTGGYLMGFIVMGLCYWLLTAFFGTSPLIKALALFCGLILLYAFGTLWFWLVYLNSIGAVSLLVVLGWCVFPFVVPDLLKLALAMVLIHRLSIPLKALI